MFGVGFRIADRIAARRRYLARGAARASSRRRSCIRSPRPRPQRQHLPAAAGSCCRPPESCSARSVGRGHWSTSSSTAGDLVREGDWIYRRADRGARGGAGRRGSSRCSVAPPEGGCARSTRTLVTPPRIGSRIASRPQSRRRLAAAHRRAARRGPRRVHEPAVGDHRWSRHRQDGDDQDDRDAGVGAAARKVMLVAPTGRAARRMSEASGFEARTVHSALSWIPGEGPSTMRTTPLEAAIC